MRHHALAMRDSRRRKFKLLSDEEFWKLPREDRLQYLKAAAEVTPKRPAKPAKGNVKKHA